VTVQLSELAPYEDDRGNRVEYAGPPISDVSIKFRGQNNRLSVASDARLMALSIDFDCDHGRAEIGGSSGPRFAAAIRVGEQAVVTIGRNVSATTKVAISAAECSSITVGDDVMFASDVQVRCDDGHPVFDVRTGRRVNVSRSIIIGDHVWLGLRSAVLGGATIGRGTVVGLGSVVTKDLPNNVVAAGAPAKVVRRDIAWERPHLTLNRPLFKRDGSTVTKSRYWELTEGGQDASTPAPRKATSRLRRLVRRVRRRLTRARATS
jgi:acetyltransferase-like isoleucine patch superfamily enzyme